MTFAEPVYLALILLVVPVLWLRRKRQAALGHSQVAVHRQLRSATLLGWLPLALFFLAWASLAMAMARPQLPKVVEKTQIETRDFIIAVDISGSMWISLNPSLPGNNSGSSNSGSGSSDTQRTTRIDAAQEAVKIFVSQRKGDRVALFVFDSDTYYHWPLSNDLSVISEKADLLNKTQGGGTNFEGPTELNPGMGPLQAAINHFQKYGKAKTKVLIMVTDGEDNISPARMDQLQAQLQAQGIRLYVLGVGDSWANGRDLDLRTFTEKMGGVVIPVGDPQQMRFGMDKIDRLEKSAVVLEKETDYKDIYQWFLAAGIALFLLYLITSALTREIA